MKAIDYVVRTSAGSSQASAVPADENVFVIDAGVDQEISLNLRQADINGYNREGRNLEVILADGRVIILENYFEADGSAASRLFISADGYLNEVTLVEEADGAVYAQYGPTEDWGKWSPTEDLIFLDGSEVAVAGEGEETVSMLGAGLLGGSGLMSALGLGAAGVTAATVLGDDNGGGTPAPDERIEPTVNEEGPIVIGGDDVDPETEAFGISGTAEPGSTVVVTIGGETVQTTSGDDGRWEVQFQGETFPDDGEHTVTVVVNEPDGTETTLEGPEVVIDTVGPDTAVLDTTFTTDDVINAEEYNDGVEVLGTGEPGASISVTIEGVTHTAVVSDAGEWSVIYPAGELPEGEYQTQVSVVSSDSFGNTTSLSETITIDTVPHPIAIHADTVEGDGAVNFNEASDGVEITGTSAPGATVTVAVEGLTQQVVVGTDGTWSAVFDGLPGGEYDATITATTVDGAGNTSSTSETIRIDTEVRDFSMTAETGGADGVINAAEAPDGFTVTGTTEPGSTVVLEMNGQVVNAAVAQDGSWTASFSGDQIQPGTYTSTLVATTTDPAGNVETLSQSVEVDTEAGHLTLNAAAIGGDGTINAAEAAAGVDVTGEADPNATVIVTLDGVSHTVQADGNGNWTTTYTNAEITPGTHVPEVSAVTTDAAGNSRSVEATVNVDTEVENLGFNPHDLATTTSGAEVINDDVADAGFDITGTVEPGSTVVVTLDGVTHTATVDNAGNWTAQFAAGEIASGERSEAGNLQVQVTDPAGNTDTLSDTIAIDTLVNELSLDTPVEGDNVINAAEASDGVQVGGQVEAGSTVQVAVFGQTYNATVDGNGNWTADIPAGDIPADEISANMVVSATDAAGNTSSLTQQLTVDTVVPDDPDVVGAFRETGGGYRSVTLETPEEDVSIHQVDGSGNATQLSLHESEDAFLGETDYFFLDGAGAVDPIPDGSELVVTRTDDAGNSSSTYLVLDETSTTAVDVGSIGLDGFNIDEIDLRLGDNRELTLTEAQLRDLSENGDQLVVRGDSQDTLNISGAQPAGTTQIEGETFNVFTLGTDATVVVDDEVTVNTI